MTPDTFPFHADASLGPVTLDVADVSTVSDFYTGLLGMREITGAASGDVGLGVDDAPMIILRDRAGAPTAPPGSAGLFHVAFLVPDRSDLSAVARRLIGAGVPLGSADHLVSEALYLEDPEGNGIEIYRDRPAGDWPRHSDGRIRMATLALDPELVDVASSEAGLPSGAIIGHVHLRTSDLPAAVAFYRDEIGLEPMATLPGAAFLGAGGYHHHIGLNTWQSASGPTLLPGALGLVGIEIRRHGRKERELLDPSGIPVRLRS